MALRGLIERLDGVERRAFPGTVFRHYSPSHAALSGEGARRAGGRWNPPDSFPVLYTGLDVATVDREFARSLRRAGLPREHAPTRRLASIKVRLSRVLDLSDTSVLAILGLSASQVVGEDVLLCQRLGAAAHHLGYEAILAPSATGDGLVLALLLDTRAAESVVEIESEDDSYLPTG